MISKKIKIDLHEQSKDRPIALLVQAASAFDSSIFIQFNDKMINAKSIMGMMNLGMLRGEEVTLLIDGKDEAAAMEGFVAQINNC